MNHSSLRELKCESQDEELVTLSLSSSSSQDLIPTPTQNPFALPSPLPPPPPPPPPSTIYLPIDLPTSSQECAASSARPSRARRTPTQALRAAGKSETIPPPYPWATAKRATVHNLHHLSSIGIDKIRGLVQCKRCDKQHEIEFDLSKKFLEIASFVSKNKDSMHDRAPAVWGNPTLPDCEFCGQKSCVKPVMGKKRSINWLFLLLGQMLGCCKLAELKYFCKHTGNHRTGAKDRVLYLTYLGLCKQLDPQGSFHRLN